LSTVSFQSQSGCVLAVNMESKGSSGESDAPQPDIAVIVEGERVMTFSLVLALSSPVFAALLRSPMAEAINKEVSLPGKSKEDFELFVALLLRGSGARVSPDNVDRMLPWCDEYQVRALKDDCEEVLLSMPCTCSRAAQAQTFALKRQYQRCLRDLPAAEFRERFADLAREPQAVRDMLPRMQKELPGLGPVLAVICSTLDTPRFPSAVPLFALCVQDERTLDVDSIRSLQEFADNPAAGDVPTKLLAAVLETRCNLLKLFSGRAMSVAEEVYTTTSSRNGIDKHLRAQVMSIVDLAHTH